MTQKTDSRRQEMTITLVQKTMSTTKKRKAGDKVGCKAEWLIEEGDEMIKSFEILYNSIV